MFILEAVSKEQSGIYRDEMTVFDIRQDSFSSNPSPVARGKSFCEHHELNQIQTPDLAIKPYP